MKIDINEYVAFFLMDNKNTVVMKTSHFTELTKDREFSIQNFEAFSKA